MDVQVVAENIARRIFDRGASGRDEVAQNPIYIHHSGDHEIPVSGLREWLQEQYGTEMKMLPSSEWVKRATELGMHEMVAEYMISRDSRRRLFTPRILKEG